MSKFCTGCGEKITENDAFCSKCGKPTGAESTTQVYVNPEAKSKLGAGLIAIFLGSLGVHNFYLGYNGKAVAQLLLTLVGWVVCGIGPFVALVWSFVEGIQILAGSITCDANGVPLKD